jgi:hypothetical protein
LLLDFANYWQDVGSKLICAGFNHIDGPFCGLA